VTGQQWIMMAFRRIGQERPGYTTSPELLQDALNEWVLFYDMLGSERNAQYSNPHFEYPVTGAGSQTGGNGYLIGPTATTAPATATTLAGGASDFLGPRPESIIRANCIINTAGQPVYIPLRPVSQEEWASLAVQQIPGVNITNVFWYDPQFPNGVINFFPPISGNTIQIYQWGILTPPANLGAQYAAPPGYGEMVVSGLAERLYHMVTKKMCPRPAPYQVIAGKAHRALDQIRAVNRPIPRLASDFPSGSGPDGFYDSFVSYTGEPT
jgi:hypothetical protein